MTDALDLAEIEALARAAVAEAPGDRWSFINRASQWPKAYAYLNRMDPATTLRLLERLYDAEGALCNIEADLVNAQGFNAEVGRLRCLLTEKDAEIERLKADRGRWRDAAERGKPLPSVSYLRSNEFRSSPAPAQFVVAQKIAEVAAILPELDAIFTTLASEGWQPIHTAPKGDPHNTETHHGPMVRVIWDDRTEGTAAYRWSDSWGPEARQCSWEGWQVAEFDPDEPDHPDVENEMQPGTPLFWRPL